MHMEYGVYGQVLQVVTLIDPSFCRMNVLPNSWLIYGNLAFYIQKDLPRCTTNEVFVVQDMRSTGSRHATCFKIDSNHMHRLSHPVPFDPNDKIRLPDFGNPPFETCRFDIQRCTRVMTCP